MYGGNIVGEIEYENTKIENCYGNSNLTVEGFSSAYCHGQAVGRLSDNNHIVNGYLNTQSNMLFTYLDNSQGSQINKVDVDGFNTQAFCDKLNEWVENNNEEGIYSTWSYNASKNNGYPYLNNLEV